MKNPFTVLFHKDRRKEHKAMQNRSDLTWYQDEIRKTEHMQRINMVSDIDSYLLREHKVLQRPNFNFKDKEFQTAKIILQTVKMIVNFHASYTVGNPISFTGDKELVELMERVYHKGQFTKQDYEITTQLMKYGNAWEYIYLQDNKIKSKVFVNDECYPCYDDKGNYYAFIEYWRDKDSGAEYHTIYYPDKVETYIDNELTDTHTNLTGLPIHYKSMGGCKKSCVYEDLSSPDKRSICKILLSILWICCCRMFFLFIVYPSSGCLYISSDFFLSKLRHFKDYLCGLCPHPASGIRLGFSGNTFNANGIRIRLGRLLFRDSRPGLFFYKY